MLQRITDDWKDPGDLYTKDDYYADGKAVQDSQITQNEASFKYYPFLHQLDHSSLSRILFYYP